MYTIVLQLSMAFLGSLGFAFIFGLRRKLLIPSSAGGLISWAIFLLCSKFMAGVFAPCLIASAFSALYAELLARTLKAPVTLFFLPAVVPLIPGSTLYYAMSNVVQGNIDAARHYGTLTVQYALAISAGMSLVWALCVMVSRIRNRKC
jgi:uncharacterized membrane protein YjjB (DUF3815 family)